LSFPKFELSISHDSWTNDRWTRAKRSHSSAPTMSCAVPPVDARQTSGTETSTPRGAAEERAFREARRKQPEGVRSDGTTVEAGGTRTREWKDQQPRVAGIHGQPLAFAKPKQRDTSWTFSEFHVLQKKLSMQMSDFWLGSKQNVGL
jgi:hypothetical protein